MIKYKFQVVENFLDHQDFESLCNLNIDREIKTSTKVYQNTIKNNQMTFGSLDKDLIETLHKKYHDKAIDILKKLSPDKVSLYDYSDFSIIVTNKDCKFPFHDDTPNKLLSGVIYLYPEKNTGTIFSKNKKGDDKHVIDWKQNRGVFFSRKEKETWHSYEGDGENNRVVLVYNLNTYRIKDVYKIENKNYFIGNLRYKINPYIYQFFKTTI